MTQDFLYPSISNGCLTDGGNVLATAISVAGPAKIPAPGPGPGQTAYVFTAIGTFVLLAGLYALLVENLEELLPRAHRRRGLSAIQSLCGPFLSVPQKDRIDRILG